MSKLSKSQQSRLAGLMTIMCGQKPISPIAEDLTSRGLAYWENGNLVMTPDGQGERDRLQILAGLMVSEDYVQKRTEKSGDHNKSTSSPD